MEDCSTTITTDEFMFLYQNQPVTKRRVQFAPVVNAIPANPLCFDAWYSSEELLEFKEHARRIIHSSLLSSSATTTTKAIAEERGFESATPERRKHRHLSIRCTLSAARQGLSVYEISRVAQQCSQWNLDAAFWQACHDYAAVYQPEMTKMIPELHSPVFPFPTKRCSDTSTTSDRRVRRRLSATV